MGILHIFDMDGTLLRGSTASLQLAEVLSDVPRIITLEAQFAAGDIDTQGFSIAIHQMWRALTTTTVKTAFAASPWLTGIREVCADIRQRGERSAVITMSPDFFANHLRDLGFDEVVASRFPPLPFTTPLDPDGILTPADKVRVTEELRARYALAPSRCVAYGDSMSDAPLFRHLSLTVAVNADHHLAGLAAASYRGDDLSGAYDLARTLITSSAGSPVRGTRTPTFIAETPESRSPQAKINV